MKRRLFFLERILYGDGTQPFNGVFVLKIKGRLERGRMIGALERIQMKYALLRARVEKDERGVPWFVVHEDVPPVPIQIIEREGDEDWIKESCRQWAEPFQGWKGPLLRIAWLRGEDVSDLVMAFHHCCCDGGSAMALMRDLLFLLDQPEGEIGGTVDLVTMAELLPKGRGMKARGISKLIRLGLSAGAFLTPTRGKKLILRSADYLVHWKLSPGLTAAVFHYCKYSKVTVNTLLCVAALQAFKEVRGARAHQVVTCPVDIRRYHPGIGRDELFAFGLAVTLSLKRKEGRDFGRLVKDAQEIMTGKLGKLNAYEFLSTMEHTHPAVGAMIKVLTYGKPGNDLMFSNMGRLDLPERYSSFEIETIYSPTVIGPFGNPTTLISTTYKGQLDFCLVSNRTVLAEEEAWAIRDCMRGLFEQVGEPINHMV
ncbi:MAG: hypothetical protein JST68_02590 [Bacteroidetes bacterium]|nr:hypothetical protein [Bacteroidota bacterium]